MKPVHHIAEGFRALTPYLIVDGAVKAIEFYKAAFGAKEIVRMPMPDGRLAHAEIEIGDCKLMMADGCEATLVKSPQAYGGTPVTMCLYVEDCDAATAKALELGAKIIRPLEDHFYGDRSATISDPFGHIWTISTHKEDVTPEETQRRADALFAQK